MCVYLNLNTIKLYLIKLAEDIDWQPSYLVGERASLDRDDSINSNLSLKVDKKVPTASEVHQ
jgi:hypothetical protein